MHIHGDRKEEEPTEDVLPKIVSCLLVEVEALLKGGCTLTRSSQLCVFYFLNPGNLLHSVTESKLMAGIKSKCFLKKICIRSFGMEVTLLQEGGGEVITVGNARKVGFPPPLT